jgi:hypothetical protein
MRLVRSIIAAASLAAIASQALAHTPRMNSGAFWAEHDVSAETACSTDIFTPVVGLSFDEPGLYLAVVRFRCPAPAGTRSRDEPPGRLPIGQRGKRENA